MKERYISMMSQAKMSEKARYAFYEKLDEKSAARRTLRPLTAVLAALCICALLAGSVLAVEAVTGMGLVELIKGKTSNKNIGYRVEFPSTTVFPISDFSEDVRNIDSTEYSEFQTWEDAEEHLGIDLLNNTLLVENARPVYSLIPDENGKKHRVHCVLRCDGYEGQLYRASASAEYELYRTVNDKNVEFIVNITADVLADHPTAYKSGDEDYLASGAYFDPNDTEALSVYSYTSPNGLSASVVIVDWDGELSRTFRNAYFTLNGVSVCVSVYSNPYTASDATEDVLAEILDAFEI